MISGPVLMEVSLLGCFGLFLDFVGFLLVSLGFSVYVCLLAFFRRIYCFYFAIQTHEEEKDLKD